jgi:hypothetical protein
VVNGKNSRGRWKIVGNEVVKSRLQINKPKVWEFFNAKNRYREKTFLLKNSRTAPTPVLPRLKIDSRVELRHERAFFDHFRVGGSRWN